MDLLCRQSLASVAFFSAARRSSRYFEAFSPVCHTLVLTSPLSSWHTAKFLCFDKSVIAANDIVLSRPSLDVIERSYSISTFTFLPMASFRNDSLLSQAYGSPYDSLFSRLFPICGALTLDKKTRTVF